MFAIIPTKKIKGLCTAYRCKNKHTKKDRFCAKHRHRYNKKKHPVKYAYQSLKGNARRRGKPFELTLKEFRQFCTQTDYINKKGRLAGAASIDRIDPRKGYSSDNIQILSLSENAKKYHTDKEDCPF